MRKFLVRCDNQSLFWGKFCRERLKPKIVKIPRKRKRPTYNIDKVAYPHHRNVNVWHHCVSEHIQSTIQLSPMQTLADRQQ